MAESEPAQIDLAELLAQLQTSLLAPTQHAAALPSASDLSFERTLSRPFGKQLDQTSAQLFTLATSLLRWADPVKNASYQVDGELVVDGVYNDVAQRVEGLLEGADECIEEALGTGKRAATVGATGAKPGFVAPSPSAGPSSGAGKNQRLPPHLLRADIPKPQLAYSAATYPPPPPLVPGREDEPLWKPVIEAKPHALSPTAPYILKETFVPASKNATPSSKPPRWRYAHPYAAELGQVKPPATFFTAPMEPERKADNSFEETPFEFVGTVEGLENMMQEIEGQERKELAIDLEHHDLRSWTGLCSLIQLSTRTKDYVLDALAPALRPHLQRLNKYTADPTWIKVFHGAQSDIVWLQRDFGLYVVGLFDTYHATVVLDHPQHSLASLLARYTSFTPDKRYQLADWRIRPIPSEMLHYARSDTHYLLDIYDHLRLALLALPHADAQPLQTVFDRSIGVSATVHEIVPYDKEDGQGEGGWHSLLVRWRKKSTSTGITLPGWGPGEISLEVLKEVHEWRERTAREEDESATFVMSFSTLLKVVEGRPEKKEDLAKLGVGEIGRKRADELLAAIQRGVATAERSPKNDAGNDKAVAEAAEQPSVNPLATLWGDVAQPVSVAKATSSSFFGSSPAPKPSASVASSTLQAGSSSFFGSSAAKAVKRASPVLSSSSAIRRAAVEKIHAGLMLGGGLADSLKPKFVPAAPEAPKPVASSSMEVDAPLPTPDHSFVPLSARETRPVSLLVSSSLVKPTASTSTVVPEQKNSDVIVVSSLADKPKKRRHAPKEAVEMTEEGDVPEKKKKKGKKVAITPEEREAIVPFDYSTHTSILDAEPVPDGGAKKSKKEKAAAGGGRKKGFEIDTSEFRKQPRVNNQMKKGNVSRSFAS